MNARLFALLSLFAACQGAPPPLPDEVARGLVQADQLAPAGAATWDRPTWRVGDRFTLVRGERLRGDYTVVAAENGVYTLDTGANSQLRRDLDLGNLGAWSGDGREPVRLMSPVDVRYHWPLWIGKRWQCEFVDSTPGGPQLTMQAGYLVEAMDTIRVPAGEFRALRIVRTLRLVGGEGEFLTRTQLTWYAPDEGIEVRQLLGDTMVELVEFARG